MFYVGIDPSFKRTGISIYNSEGNSITLNKFENKETFGKGFEGVLEVVPNMVRGILSLLPKGPMEVISECPPPQGMFSPGLWSLDTVLLLSLKKRVDKLYIVYSNYLSHLHGTRRYNKSESVTLSNSLLEVSGFDYTSSRMPHDTHEANIFLMRLLYRNHLITDEVLDVCANLEHEKEKLIYEKRNI